MAAALGVGDKKQIRQDDRTGKTAPPPPNRRGAAAAMSVETGKGLFFSQTTVEVEASSMIAIRCILIVSVLSGSAAMAGEAATKTFAPGPDGGTTFTMPSGNVECHYSPPEGTQVYKPMNGQAELSCDRAAPVYMNFSLSARGTANATKNPGEQSCCSDLNALPYDSAWRMGPFVCESSRAGLNCKNAEGHGFIISRSIAKTY
jgi:hypothetical protein